MSTTIADLQGTLGVDLSPLERAYQKLDGLNRQAERAFGQATRGASAFRGALDGTEQGLDKTSTAAGQATPKLETVGRNTREAAGAGREWKGVLDQLPGSLGAVASRVEALSGLMGAAGLAAAVGAVGVAILALSRSLADDIERMDNLSRQTGLSVGALQAFEHAARQAGEAPEGLALSFGRLNQAIADVVMGKDDAGESFRAIGVDLEALVRQGAPTEAILEATARALVAALEAAAAARIGGTAA